ncbi:hypothetical protein NMG60_11016117 [Bertholletia excelsa]
MPAFGYALTHQLLAHRWFSRLNLLQDSYFCTKPHYCTREKKQTDFSSRNLEVCYQMGRSPCCEKAHTNKGAWSKEEDERLIAYIRANGQGCWRSLPKAAGLLRCGKSCRLRWINYLRPDLKRGNFTDEEVQLIIKLHSLYGNKWSLIAGSLPGRTDNEIKNYWNTHIRRKLLSSGVDPATYRPVINNKPAVSTSTTITFAAAADQTKEEQKCRSKEENPHQVLNLELQIGLPSQVPPNPSTGKTV